MVVLWFSFFCFSHLLSQISLEVFESCFQCWDLFPRFKIDGRSVFLLLQWHALFVSMWKASLNRFLKKEFLLGNSCPLWQALLLGRQFQNSNLKSFFRIVQQYYWEDTISCQPNHILIMLYLWKIQVFYFAFAFRNIFVCVSASSCWYCLLFFMRYGFEDCLIIVASS